MSDKKIKIAWDVSIALSFPRGMGIYIINILKYMSEFDKENIYYLYSNIPDLNNIFPKQENFNFRLLNSKNYLHYEQVVLPIACKKDEVNILHSPSITSPIFLSKKIKRIITLHDVMFLQSLSEIPLSKIFYQNLSRLYRILTIKSTAKKCNHIFTDSKHSKSDIMNHLGISSDKIAIEYCGNEHFSVNLEASFSSIEEKFKIKKPYIFNIGGDAPTKNSEALINLFANAATLSDINLVIAGFRNIKNSYIANKYKNLKNVHFIPYATQEEIIGLYKNSELFIFPSTYEGFGIPLLEAMKCEVPIICSNVTSLPEIAGNAAILINPYNFNEIEDKILFLLENKVKQQELINNGLVQLKKFSWEKSAKNILKIYNKMCVVTG
jgi:glycosyltransferase involved in cell wall biosynthesis